MAATHWEDDNLLVRMAGVLRFCCDASTNIQASMVPAGPPDYSRRHHQSWSPAGSLLHNHRLESRRYTILPTITAVSPWDGDDDGNSDNIIDDQVFEESQTLLHMVRPVPSPTNSITRDAAINTTQRFYDALRAVLYGPSTPDNAPALRETSRDSMEAAVAELAPHIQETSSDSLLGGQHTSSPDSGMSPLLQVCAGLGVLVLLMVILFHSHHFRRDCRTERRALRRVARRYHVTQTSAQQEDDVETNPDIDSVTDVTL